MSGNSNKDSTQTSSPWSGSADYLKSLMQQSQEWYSGMGTGYQGLTDAQKDSIESMRDFYNTGMGGTTDTSLNAWNSLMRTPEEVATSQQVQNMIKANTAAINTSLMEDVMPGIRSGAIAAGGYGGSRQGVAEGVAAGKAADAATKYATDLTGNIYQQQLQNQMNALSAAPLLQEMQGNQYQGIYDLEELLKADNAGADNYWLNRLQQYANLLYPTTGFGGSVTTSGGSNGVSALQGAAGGATAGSAFGPWGAVIGGGLGALSTQI